MPDITYVQPNGSRHVVSIPNGLSIMEGALNGGVSGIDADCGGACACATCRVVIDPAWASIVGPPVPAEAEMLEFSEQATEGSRLSCQVTVKPDFDGLVVHVPASQR